MTYATPTVTVNWARPRQSRHAGPISVTLDRQNALGLKQRPRGPDDPLGRAPADTPLPGERGGRRRGAGAEFGEGLVQPFVPRVGVRLGGRAGGPREGTAADARAAGRR